MLPHLCKLKIFSNSLCFLRANKSHVWGALVNTVKCVRDTMSTQGYMKGEWNLNLKPLTKGDKSVLSFSVSFCLNCGRYRRDFTWNAISKKDMRPRNLINIHDDCCHGFQVAVVSCISTFSLCCFQTWRSWKPRGGGTTEMLERNIP